MAINLSGKSDASIIASATRAGLATAPPDYSKTFQRVADSYDKTMQAQASMWDEIGKATVKIGEAAIENAKKHSLEKLYEAGASQDFINEALDIKNELKEYSFLKKGFGDAETRQKRMELQAKRKKLFAEVEHAGITLDNAVENAANLDYDLMGIGNSEMVNAIFASNTSNPITEGGNMAKLSRNKKTGVLEYKMLKSDGIPVLNDVTKEPVTMSLTKFKDITTNYVKDTKGAVPKAFNDLDDYLLKAGRTFGGEFNDYHKDKVMSIVKNMTNTELGLLRAYKANYGGTSFFDDMSNPSVLSATLFNSTLPKTKDGQLAAEGVLANLEDNDGKEGIGQQELINQFSTISGTILSGEPGREIYNQWVLDRSETPFDQGARLKNPSNNNDTELFTSIHPQGGLNLGGIQKVNKGELGTIRDALIAGGPFNIGTAAFDPDGKGGWIKTKGKTKTSYANTAELVGTLTSHEDFQNLPQYKGTLPIVEKKKDDKPGTMLSRILNPSKYFELK